MSVYLPSLFIGSSSERRDVAYALQKNLINDAHATVWDQDVFKISHPQLLNLVKEAGTYDAAAFIYSPDDETTSRGASTPSPRDNVIFETGLFIGSLALERVFIVSPMSIDLKLPSDLLGITHARYSPSHPNLVAALGTAASDIRGAIQNLNPIRTREPWFSETDFVSIMTELLCSVIWNLVYEPTSGRTKQLEFDPSGQIGVGRNQNEYMWRIKSGKLELIRSDGTIHNRFSFETSPTLSFHSTNEQDTFAIRKHKIHNQAIIA